jgi:hypothetical protein
LRKSRRKVPLQVNFLKDDILALTSVSLIFYVLYSTVYCIHTVFCFICRPSYSTVSEDAKIEPKTVATSALAIRRSNH